MGYSHGFVTAVCTSERLNQARFENDTVYCISNYGLDFVIRYYELSSDGNTCTVQCEYDIAR